MPTVSFEHLVKRYGAITIFDDLNLKVEEGDFLVLLGPSGCGKSTLLNMLAGLSEVSSGRIMIGETDVTELDPKDRGLAMVFQSYALYPTKTVYGNLKFGLAARKLDKAEIERRIDWAAKLLQIEPLLKRKPSELSGGQRQRVAIGRALVKQADVLLFDEPLSNLDAKLRTETRLEIKNLHASLKPTVVYVTHDQIEAMTMATKVAVMNGGQIQQFGTPDEIYEKPVNLFVAGFIGAPAMNLLPARFEGSHGQCQARYADGKTIDLSAYPFMTMPAKEDQLIIGLRPEHFSLMDSSINPDSIACEFSLPVQYTERTGSDATVFLSLGEQRLALRVEPDKAAELTVGEHVSICFPKGKLNVFSAQSEQRL